MLLCSRVLFSWITCVSASARQFAYGAVECTELLSASLSSQESLRRLPCVPVLVPVAPHDLIANRNAGLSNMPTGICGASSSTAPLAPSRPHSRKTCEHEGGGGTPLQVPLARPLTERGVHLAGAKTARPTGGCLPKTQVKPGYTRESPGLPEKYLDARPHAAARHTPRAPVPTAARTACSSTRTAPCVLATSAKTQKAASAPGTACRRRCGRRGRANILLQDRGGAPHALVRPRSTDRKEAAQQADCCRHTICYPTRGELGEDDHDSRVSPTHAGWSSKSCTRTAERTNV